jgi:hypothetical protein
MTDFRKLLKEFQKLNLPDGQYVIYGSGPLAVRGLRGAQDLDVVVSDELYQKLLKKYPETKKKATKLLSSVRFIRVGDIELIPASFSLIKDFEQAVDRADKIGGFRFVCLKDLLRWKKKMARPKDFEDIKLIQEYLSR